MLGRINFFLIASLGLASLASATVSYVEMAPGQGCILLAGFDVRTKDPGSLAELRIEARIVHAACGHGSSLSSQGKKHMVVQGSSGGGLTWVAYGGMLPFNNKDTQFKNFPICVIGPDQLVADGVVAKAPPGQANIDFDFGSYQWYSSDALYNATVPDGGDPAAFPKIRDCHARGDKVHLDSAVFANNEQILNLLPNPYGDDIQAAGFIKDSNWPSRVVTIQLATATAESGLLTKRTAAPRARRFGKPT